MGDHYNDAAPEQASGSWRRGWASAGAIIATLFLVGLVIMVTLTNRARDNALAWERHTQDVMLMARTVDATIARSEAALGRYVLDEEPTTGLSYYGEWRLAGRQIGRLHQLVRSEPDQRTRVSKLRKLYDERGRELAVAAAAAAAKKDSGGVSLFYQAGKSKTLPALRLTLDAISASEREDLATRIEQTQLFDAEADRLTEWLGWLGVLVGVGAIILGLLAYRALTDENLARQDADSEALRASSLEQAVYDRTRELRMANERLRAEAAERAAAEEQLRQAQKMEAVGQLTGGIAHDFNNMLAVVVGGIDLAQRKLAGTRTDAGNHLDHAMEGASRAAALTRRLLAFARSESLMPEGIAPAELVQGMLDLIDRTIGERITVRTRFAPDLWPVWADANQLENAILNLCVNARDAMNGQGTLTIAIDNVAIAAGEVGELGPGEYVRVGVSDEGVGISPENLGRVFEPFFTTKPVGKGTGLGLSQIFGFARQSGGDVTIESTPGQGTTVAVYLPRSLRAAEARSQPAGEAEELGPAPAGTRILVVEDDARVSRSTVAALEELGYAPTATERGSDALRILKGDPAVELLITDVMMPEMTGPELVRTVQERHPGIAVLFVTGFVGEAGEADSLSGYEILRKPFTVAALSQAVAAALARRASGSPPASASAAAE